MVKKYLGAVEWLAALLTAVTLPLESLPVRPHFATSAGGGSIFYQLVPSQRRCMGSVAARYKLRDIYNA